MKPALYHNRHICNRTHDKIGISLRLAGKQAECVFPLHLELARTILARQLRIEGLSLGILETSLSHYIQEVHSHK